jgi:hypothetical protein
VDTFDLKDCVRIDDKVYVWDTRTKSIVELDMRAIALADCPESAVRALLTVGGRRKQSAKEESK